MLLAGALLALFMTGCWLYCLTGAILTPVPQPGLQDGGPRGPDDDPDFLRALEAAIRGNPPVS